MSAFAFQRNTNKRTRMGGLRGLASSSHFLLSRQNLPFSVSPPINNTYFESVNSTVRRQYSYYGDQDQETYRFPLSSKVYIRCIVQVPCLSNSRYGRVI